MNFFLIADIISMLLDIYETIIVLNVLGSWIDPFNNMAFFRIIKKISNPYLKIFKVNIFIGGRGFDFSAIIGLMVLEFIRSLFGMAF